MASLDYLPACDFPAVVDSDDEQVEFSDAASYLTDDGDGLTWSVRSAATSVIGPRPKQEDRHSRIDSGLGSGPHPGLPRPLIAFYGVFDGHGGVRAAKIASQHVWRHVHADLTAALGGGEIPSERALHNIMHHAFASTEEEILHQAANGGWRDGSTAVCVLICGATLVVANLGDSRAVLGTRSKRKLDVVRLSEDHKPEVPAEARRIHAAGGRVTLEGGVARLNGDLSLSRAFGDAEYKPKPAPRCAGTLDTPSTSGVLRAPSTGHAGTSMAGTTAPAGKGRAKQTKPAKPVPAKPVRPPSALSALPDVTNRELRPSDTFVLLGCDGLWDVLSDREACEIVDTVLRDTGADVQAACDQLVQFVVQSADCTDNVTAVLVLLERVAREPEDDATELDSSAVYDRNYPALG